MDILSASILSFIISLLLIIRDMIKDRKINKKNILKVFFALWATIYILIILIMVQILGALRLLNIL